MLHGCFWPPPIKIPTPIELSPRGVEKLSRGLIGGTEYRGRSFPWTVTASYKSPNYSARTLLYSRWQRRKLFRIMDLRNNRPFQKNRRAHGLTPTARILTLGCVLAASHPPRSERSSVSPCPPGGRGCRVPPSGARIMAETPAPR